MITPKCSLWRANRSIVLTRQENNLMRMASSLSIAMALHARDLKPPLSLRAALRSRACCAS
jgi:hypothetical protein